MTKLTDSSLDKAVKKHFKGIKNRGLAFGKKVELAVKSIQEAETGSPNAPFTAITSISFGDCGFNINGIAFCDHVISEKVDPRVTKSPGNPNHTIVDGLPHCKSEDDIFPSFVMLQNMPNLETFDLYSNLAVGDATPEFNKTSKLSVEGLFKHLKKLKSLKLGDKTYNN